MPEDTIRRSLVVRDLTLAYGEVPVVESVSFEASPASVLGIVGESGSGKSTLALAIAGFLPHFGGRVVSGELTVAGQARATQRPRAAAIIPPSTPGVTMVFQDAMTSMDPVATIGSQLGAALRLAQRATRGERRRQALRLLESVGFPSAGRHLRMRPGELSGGMRQRALVAIALASRPDVLVADEPTSALDVKLANLTMRLLVDSAREHGMTLIIVAHDLHLVAAHVDAIAVMRAGHLVEYGPAARVLDAPREAYTRQLLACVPSLEAYQQERLVTVTTTEGVR